MIGCSIFVFFDQFIAYLRGRWDLISERDSAMQNYTLQLSYKNR